MGSGVVPTIGLVAKIGTLGRPMLSFDVVRRNRHKYRKTVRCKIDYSKVPVVDFADGSTVAEKNIRGWGPGGQAVSKTNNCISLRHVPTGVSVKCHESRSLIRNREIAREKLITALDNHYNGEDSVESQAKRISAALSELDKDSKEVKRQSGISKRLAEKEAKLVERLEYVQRHPDAFLDSGQKIKKLERDLKEVRSSMDRKSPTKSDPSDEQV